MIYSVHFYYKKLNGRKHPSKFEGIIFAANKQRVHEIIEEMINGLPIETEPFSIIGTEKSLEEIYEERPELNGISPEEGYVYNRFSHIHNFRKYAGLK